MLAQIIVRAMGNKHANNKNMSTVYYDPILYFVYPNSKNQLQASLSPEQP
jgi:hypothetical protein